MTRFIVVVMTRFIVVAPRRVPAFSMRLLLGGDGRVRAMASGDSRFGVDVSLDPDPLIEAYKRDIDRTLIRENLKLTPEGRLRKLTAFMDFVHELRRAPRRKP
jgi:hypothetical protein